MQLLLLLSAMLAGLISGDRTVEVRSLDRTAVAAAAAAEIGGGAVHKAIEARVRQGEPATVGAVPEPIRVAVATMPPGTAPVDERRLE